MASCFILWAFDPSEGKEGKRDIIHSYYELTEPENNSGDFLIFQSPIFQEANPFFQETENCFPIENSEAKNVESNKIKSKKTKKK